MGVTLGEPGYKAAAPKMRMRKAWSACVGKSFIRLLLSAQSRQLDVREEQEKCTSRRNRTSIPDKSWIKFSLSCVVRERTGLN